MLAVDSAMELEQRWLAARNCKCVAILRRVAAPDRIPVIVRVDIKSRNRLDILDVIMFHELFRTS